jgi:hypothetical protein
MTISSAAFAQYVEERFGSDAAFKIEFRGLDGRRMSLDEGDTLYKALGDDCPDLVSVFPDGLSATVCTNYAIHVSRALPDRVVIVGFAKTTRPRAPHGTSFIPRATTSPLSMTASWWTPGFALWPGFRNKSASTSTTSAMQLSSLTCMALARAGSTWPRSCDAISFQESAMPTQQQVFYQVQRNLADANLTFMDLVRE